MASIAAPLIGAIAPQIISLITGLVHRQAPITEANNGPGTGLVKFADVFGAVVTALQSAAAAGSISPTLPSDDVIRAIIQAVITSMKLSGLLGDAVTPQPPGWTSRALALKPGESITISVG